MKSTVVRTTGHLEGYPGASWYNPQTTFWVSLLGDKDDINAPSFHTIWQTKKESDVIVINYSS